MTGIQIFQPSLELQNHSSSSDHLPSVSIIIATYNNEETLGDCFESISLQDYPSQLLEVIVADGGSKDQTLDICRNNGAVILHNERKTEKGFQGGKSLAVRGAHYEIVIVLDADNVLGTRDYVREITLPLRSDSEVVAVSPIISANPLWSSFERYAAYVYDPFDYLWNPTCEERMLRSSSSKNRFVELGCLPEEKVYLGNGTAVRRKALLTVGGYDFDLETGKRIYRQGRMILSTRATVFHHNATSIRHFFRKRIRQARELPRYASNRTAEEGFANLVLPKTRDDLLRLQVQVVGNLSLIHPFVVSMREIFHRSDPAMWWHCLMAPLVTLCYALILSTDKSGRTLLATLLRKHLTAS